MKYFTIKELIYSSTAKAKGIDNTPNSMQAACLVALVDNVLDPLRAAYNKPVKVNSAFRSAELNEAVGGAATSQHMKGEAADITAGSKEENRKLFEIIQTLKLPFDQLIDEKDFTWIHISYRQGNNRGQVLSL